MSITTQIVTPSEAEFFHPPLVHTDGQGQQYKLRSWRTEPVILESHSSEEESLVLYEQIEGKERIPERLPVVIEDENTGETAEGKLALCQTEVTNEQWVDGFQFPVVFHRYDAQFYELENYLIPYDDEKPALAGYEHVLLDMIEADPEDYEILDIVWDGEVYSDEEGTLCRNAAARGRKRVKDYEAVYRGEVVWPQQEIIQCVAEYTPTEAVVPPTDEIQPPVEKEQKPGLTFWQKLKIIWAVTIALAVVIWLLCILLLWLEKKKQKKQEER